MKYFKAIIHSSLFFCILLTSIQAQDLTAEQVINRYIESLGGKSAIEKNNSRISKGTLTDRRGNKLPIEQYSKLPELGLLLINPNSPTEFKQWFDGAKGFTTDSENGTREFSGVFLTLWRRNNNLHLPIKLNEFFTKIEFKEKDKKKGHNLNCLTMTTPIPNEEIWCFDDQTGLLYSRNLTIANRKFESFFEDYRDVDGVKIPFVYKIIDQNGDLTYEWKEVKLNAPIDEAKFVDSAAKAESLTPIKPDNTKLYNIKVEEITTPSGQKYVTERSFLRVAENRAKPNSNTIELAVLQLKSKSSRRASPLIYLAGGPGSSAIAEARSPFMIQLFEQILQTRDVILFDQRGTGQSKPAVIWRSNDSLPTDVLISEEKIINYMRLQGEKAVASFKERNIDLIGYNTIESSNDINDLRQAIGAEKVSLLGFSYGTHLGLATIRQYSEYLDSVVLIGTEGLNHTLKLPSTFDNQLRKLSDLAAQDENVKNKVPDMVALLKKVLDRVEKEPITISIMDHRKQQPVEIKIGKFALQLLIRFDIGDGNDFVEYPLWFYAMDKGDYSILRKYVEKRFNQLSGGISGMSTMMDLSSGITAEKLKNIQNETPNSILGNAINFPDTFIKDVWGNPDLGDAFRTPFKTKTRTFFVSGTLDSNTPTEQTEEIRQGFSKNNHLILQYGGHEDMLPNEEVQKAIVEFLNGKDVGNRTINQPKPKFKPIP